jgi:hypothetical protein
VFEDLPPAAREIVTASGTVEAAATGGGTVRTCATCYAPERSPGPDTVPPCRDFVVRRVTIGG